MSLARLPCCLFLKAHAYVSQPLGRVLTNVNTYPAVYMCLNNHTQAFCKYLHTKTQSHLQTHICMHSRTSGLRALKQSHKALQHKHTYPYSLL